MPLRASGTAKSFDAARAAFDVAWQWLLPNFTEADFTDYRRHRWNGWRAILKGAFGLADRMTPQELAFFREVADRDPPRRKVRELWCAISRRGGKDSATPQFHRSAGNFFILTFLSRPSSH
jgi:hypothetical protein